MTVWDLGDRVPLRHRVYDADAELVDATVTLSVIAPDGTITTPTVTHTSLGTYDASVLTDQVNQWRYIWTVSGTVDDVTTDTFDVADPAPPLYCGLARLKRALKLDPDDASRDEDLLEFLGSSSRGVDDHAGRTFWLDRTATTRVFGTGGRVSVDDNGYYCLDVDDIGDTTDMVVEVGSDDTSWTTITDYTVGPRNALAKGKPGTYLRRATSWGVEDVRITVRWGWPSIPDVVQQATQLQASRLNKRADSPAGVLGSTDWGGPVPIARLDPDVRTLLEKVCKLT